MTQEREAFEAWFRSMGPVWEGTPKASQWVAWQAARASLAQPASVPAGWKLVPVEPTLAMLDALRADTTPYLPDRYRAMLAAAPQAPQPAQADMAPEYAAAVRELADQSGMSGAQVLRAAIRLYQAEQKGLVTVEHKEQIGPLAAPQPEAQPSMTPEQVRDGIADWIETNVNHREFWTPEVADLIRSIEIRPEAYAHRAAPSPQAEQGGTK